MAALGLAALAGCLSLTLALPASAQFWPWGDRRPVQQPQRPQQTNPFANPFGNFWEPQREPRQQRERERAEPADFSRAPGPSKKADTAAPNQIVVIGDAMADWLGLGLEEAVAEKPEFAIQRRHRTYTGLIRYDTRRDIEWAQAIKEIVTADKPKLLVMMIGVNDRQQIRERAPAAPTAAARPGAAAAKPADKPVGPAAVDPELQAQQSADQQNAELQEPPPAISAPEPRGAQANQGPFEFHTEKWEVAYIRRIDATIAAMKAARVPVLWVGLPSQRNSRASSDSAYLNDLYRQRAEKAGIVYVDVWDGFVDDAGRFTQQGPDFEGQIRRLRAGDGVYFTKFGARKLAHYVEREIQRSLSNPATPVALPTDPIPVAPGDTSSRPLAGPVVPLTVLTGGGDELMGAERSTRPNTPDPVATRVLTRGEPIPAPNGRGDDFAWPRGSAPMVVNVEPGPTPPTTAAAATPPTTAAAAGQQPAAGQPKAQGAPPTVQNDETKPAQKQQKRSAPRPQAARPAPWNPFGNFR